MGGLMSYQRMRNRNGLMYRKPDGDPDPYWRGDVRPPGANGMLVGDLNRMERDYLAEDGGLSGQVAEVTGADLETVRKVLRYVFLEQP